MNPTPPAVNVTLLLKWWNDKQVGIVSTVQLHSLCCSEQERLEEPQQQKAHTWPAERGHKMEAASSKRLKVKVVSAAADHSDVPGFIYTVQPPSRAPPPLLPQAFLSPSTSLLAPLYSVDVSCGGSGPAWLKL